MPIINGQGIYEYEPISDALHGATLLRKQGANTHRTYSYVEDCLLRL